MQKRYIDSGIPVDQPFDIYDDLLEFAIDKAIQYGTAEPLLYAGATGTNLNRANSQKLTPLSKIYSFRGRPIHKDVVIYFIQMGADYDVDDDSLLIETLNSSEMLREIAKHGIDINKSGPSGYPLV